MKQSHGQFSETFHSAVNQRHSLASFQKSCFIQPDNLSGRFELSPVISHGLHPDVQDGPPPTCVHPINRHITLILSLDKGTGYQMVIAVIPKIKSV